MFPSSLSLRRGVCGVVLVLLLVSLAPSAGAWPETQPPNTSGTSWNVIELVTMWLREFLDRVPPPIEAGNTAKLGTDYDPAGLNAMDPGAHRMPSAPHSSLE